MSISETVLERYTRYMPSQQCVCCCRACGVEESNAGNTIASVGSARWALELFPAQRREDVLVTP